MKKAQILTRSQIPQGLRAANIVTEIVPAAVTAASVKAKDHTVVIAKVHIPSVPQMVAAEVREAS